MVLAGLEIYLSKGLGLGHFKINRQRNIHYAIVTGILTWFYCRFGKILDACIQKPG